MCSRSFVLFIIYVFLGGGACFLQIRQSDSGPGRGIYPVLLDDTILHLAGGGLPGDADVGAVA